MSGRNQTPDLGKLESKIKETKCSLNLGKSCSHSPHQTPAVQQRIEVNLAELCRQESRKGIQSVMMPSIAGKLW